MENKNINEIDIQYKYNKDDAYQALKLINEWIRNIDAKVSFALTLTGILIGIVFNKGKPIVFQKIFDITSSDGLQYIDIFAAIITGLLYFFCFASVFSFMFAICAHKKNLNGVSSIFFFSHIRENSLDTYKNKLYSAKESDIVNDLIEQIHTNSLICDKKTKSYNMGIVFLLLTFVLWFVCMFFGFI